MNKYNYPSFYKLPLNVDVDELRNDYFSFYSQAQKEGSVHCGRGNVILDLSYIDTSDLRYPDVYFAGSSTERAVSNYKAPTQLSKHERRLSVGVQRNPLADDRNHNRFKSFVIGSYTERLLHSMGRVSKATYALLEPNSWWPSHFDFSLNHAAKLNIPVITNDKAVSLAWDQKRKCMDEEIMQEGEVWWLNVARKHTAFNWGDTNRLFLLATFHDPKPFLRAVLDGDT